jgi:hypothetical protein
MVVLARPQFCMSARLLSQAVGVVVEAGVGVDVQLDIRVRVHVDVDVHVHDLAILVMGDR